MYYNKILFVVEDLTKTDYGIQASSLVKNCYYYNMRVANTVIRSLSLSLSLSSVYVIKFILS